MFDNGRSQRAQRTPEPSSALGVRREGAGFHAEWALSRNPRNVGGVVWKWVICARDERA